MILWDGVFSNMMGSLTGGAFLIAYALLLGASNTVVGLISAVGPLTQILQIPSIFLVEKTRRRKALSVTASFWGRLFWLVIIVLPFFSEGPHRLEIFLIALFGYFSLNAISTCAFNSWIRDLIPDEVMGRFWADRMAWATGIAMVMGLLAAFGIDFYKARYANDLYVYSMVFSVGMLSGMIGVVCLARIPEPRMEILPGRSLISILMEPIRDTNYRMLLFFLAAWQFAANLSAPFFAVYMLQRLNLSMSVVLLLSTLSQIVNVLFLRIWGRLADAYSNKSVLAICGPMFMLSVILWPFTTAPGSDRFALLLLIVIHTLAGVSTAGVTLCSRGIALKSAPRGRATAYLATNALVSGCAATVAPLLAGMAADGLATQEFKITLHWISDLMAHHEIQWTPIQLRGLDFLFVFSFIFGLYAVRRLILIKEVGEVKEDVVLVRLSTEIRNVMRHVSNIPGLRHFTYFPYAILKGIRNKKQR